jgi:hypothetical protein
LNLAMLSQFMRRRPQEFQCCDGKHVCSVQGRKECPAERFNVGVCMRVRNPCHLFFLTILCNGRLSDSCSQQCCFVLTDIVSSTRLAAVIRNLALMGNRFATVRTRS